MSSGSNKLLRVFGIAFGLAAVVGGVVGQGILRTPGVVAEATGSPIVIMAIWVAGAAVAMISAFAFAELGAAIPRAGGAYAFIFRAFGERIGVLAAFMLLLSFITNISFLAFVTGEFLTRLGMGGGIYSPTIMGIGLIILFTAVNALGTRTTGATQIMISAMKGMFLVGLVVALFGGAPSAVIPAADSQILRDGWLPIGTAMLVVIGAYNGWWDVVFYGEEFKDPSREIPRALFGGILGVAGLYLLVNLALLHVMSPGQMAGSNFVAADAAGIVFGERANYFITIFGILSVGAIGNLALMTATRLVYSLARAEILPHSMSKVNKRGTPTAALLFSAIVAAVIIILGGYKELSSMGVSLFQGVTVLAILAVIGLRKSEPGLERPFKTPWYPWPIILAAFLNTLLLLIFIAQDIGYSLSGFVVVGVAWVLYVFVLRRRAILESIEEDR
jgi:APA family basic amino acid/polyamine antiporter